MGMRAQCRRVTSAQLDELREDPIHIEEFVQSGFGVNADDVRATLERVQRIGLAARASGNLNDPAKRDEIQHQILRELATGGSKVPYAHEEDRLNLEKSWHVLHYLLTGHVQEAPGPLGNAILGGEEIGEERDYGRVRFLTPQQVHEVADALSNVSKDALRNRFDLEAMNAAGIYTARNQEDLELAQEYFEQLSRFYREAAENSEAMLLWIE